MGIDQDASSAADRRDPADGTAPLGRGSGDGDAREPRVGLSRRGLFGLIGAGAGGAALGAGAAVAAETFVASSTAGAGSNRTYPFFGTHQSGIATPAQDRLHFAAFDMTGTATRTDLIELLQDWSYAASRLTQGLEVSEQGATASPLSPPDDTGEAVGLPASGLSITIGFGPTLFTDASGTDRFGIASRKPDDLADLPGFRGDLIDQTISGGDLCIQACSDDPQVAVHAVRNLTRIAFGRAQIRWSQLGFGRTSSTSTAQTTPRNLFGFKDGTANLKAEDAGSLVDHVWVDPAAQPSWMAGGTYLVARKIRMTLESWDRSSLGEQEAVTGRDKADGAPLSGGGEFTPPDFSARNASGEPAIPHTSHVFLAHAEQNSGTQILRRGYNYVDGTTELGQLDAGLFFLSFQSRPEAFRAIQERLSQNDAMNEYIRHISSSVFAIPPAASVGGYVGAQLFH